MHHYMQFIDTINSLPLDRSVLVNITIDNEKGNEYEFGEFWIEAQDISYNDYEGKILIVLNDTSHISIDLKECDIYTDGDIDELVYVVNYHNVALTFVM